MIPAGYLPELLRRCWLVAPTVCPGCSTRTAISRIGPIPQGHAGRPDLPTSSCGPKPDDSVLEQVAHSREAVGDAAAQVSDLATLPAPRRTMQLRDEAFADLREPLLALSKCPDFVVNRGHYFGTANSTTGRLRRREASGPSRR